MKDHTSPMDRAIEEIGETFSGRMHVREGREYKGTSTTSRLKNVARYPQVINLLCQGFSASEVAKIVGLHQDTLHRNFYRDPEFQAMLRTANEQVFQDLLSQIRTQASSLSERASALAEEALDRMAELLNESRNENIVFKAAQDLMDRDPEQRITRLRRVEGSGPIFNLESKTLVLAMQAAREIEAREVKPEAREGKSDANENNITNDATAPTRPTTP